MAITIATIGRLMKNLDMARYFDCERLRIHLHSLANLLHAFGDHALARLEALADDPLRADAVAHLDESNVHFVVAIHDRNLIAALKFIHRALRNQKSAGLHSQRRADPTVLAGPQGVSRIREQSRHPDGAGPDVDLAIRKVESPVLRIDGPIRQNELQPQPLPLSVQGGRCRVAPVKVEIFLLG